MIVPGSVQAKGFDSVKNALAESLQSEFSKLAKDLPVGFRKVVGHYLIAAQRLAAKLRPAWSLPWATHPGEP